MKTKICTGEGKITGRILLEVACPRHGFERFSIKVMKRYNIPSKDISLQFSKLKPEEISRIYIGRDVTRKEIRRFFDNYLSRTGATETILTMRITEII